MKTCRKCGVGKSLDEFYAHRGMRDGRLNKCKACARGDVSRHKQANLDKVRAYDRRRSQEPERKALNLESSRKVRAEKPEKVREWQKAYSPEQRRAATWITNAVRDGRLKREPCWCGNPKSEGHHRDYSKPREVVWLCRQHHAMEHRLINEMKRSPMQFIEL